jgi:UDP-N-acetylmuramate--alanine ligase
MREKICLNGAKNVHFIGIGGISMSGLAEVLNRDGFIVSGSDDVETEITNRLSSIGIKIFYPNAAKNISDEIEMVVYTAAVKPDNPEFKAAAEKKIPMLERAVFIGEILKGNDAVCVAGSHGKTTTTSMLSEIALAAELDPTIFIGGHMNAGGMNYRVGDSKVFILEACEYSNSFLHWQPRVGIILNIDADHLDFFGSMENLIDAFKKFAEKIRPNGALIIQKGLEKIARDVKCDVFTFGLSNDADFYADKISYDEGKPSFDVMRGENFLAKINLPLPGEYNLLNALASFAAAHALGVDAKISTAALSNVKGTKRRFEFKGEFNGAKIIDDYAHHPTEIVACLAAARQGAGSGKIFCLFQPHTYTRTKNLLMDFAKSFSDADKIILLPIYAAREPFDEKISSEILADEIKKHGDDVIFVESFYEAKNYLREVLQPNDLLITMGAGDVFKVGDELLRKSY